MREATPSPPRPVRRNRLPAVPRKPAVLIAGCVADQEAKLVELYRGLGFDTQVVQRYEQTLASLQEQKFELWVLDAASLRLGEAMVWASLRFASEGMGLNGAGELQPGVWPRTPVVVLVRAGDPAGLRALNAAASAPTITGWNRAGWVLGVQEVPIEARDLAALTQELLAECAAALRA